MKDRSESSLDISPFLTTLALICCDFKRELLEQLRINYLAEGTTWFKAAPSQWQQKKR